MTNPQEIIVDDKSGQLLHLSNISFIPADVLSVYWEMNQPFSRKTVTRVRTRYEVFILEPDLPDYESDVDALKKALNRI